jgi:predicted phage tail component-like protein
MLTFNGNDLSAYFNVEEIYGRGPSAQEVATLSVPGRDGAYYLSKKKPPKVIDVLFNMKGTSLENLRLKMDELNKFLEVDKPSPLIFSDEPNMTYYAILNGQPDWQEFFLIGKGKLSFLCPDPYKYGLTTTIPFANSILNMTYQGAVKTFPKYKITFNQPSTYLYLSSPTESIILGKSQTVEVTQVQQENRILTEYMSSLTNWVDGSVVDNGVVTGTMVANKFRASSYGTGSQWHGPAKKRSLPTPIQDFKVQAFISQKSITHSEVGRVEVYLLDVNSKIIGKVVLRDSTTGYKYNWAVARAGNESDNHVLYDGYGANPGTWNDFDNGILEIKRVGNVWEFYIAKRDAAGNHYARLSKRWRHNSGKYNEKLAQIQVHVGAYGTHTPTTQSINTLYVDEIIQPGSNQVPNIVNTGDVLEIDCKTKKILKNGKLFNEVRDPVGSLFALNPGLNTLGLYPPDIATVEMTYQERWF